MIGACAQELRFRLLFGRARDDVQTRIQISRGEHDVNVVSIVGQTCSQASRALDSGLAQTLLQRSIAYQHVDAALTEFRGPLLIVFNHHERLLGAHQVPHKM